jgi:hypothetical protein
MVNGPINKRRGDVHVSTADLDGLTPAELQRRVDVWTPSAEEAREKSRDRYRNVYRALIYGRNRLSAAGVSPAVFRAVLVVLLLIMAMMSLLPIYRQLR